MLMVLLMLLMVVDDADDADGVDDADGLDDVDDLDDADGADADLQGRCWGSVPCLALCRGGVISKASLHQAFDSPTNAHR